jgi:NAD+ synthase
MNFDAEKIKNNIIKWIAGWFEENGKGCSAVVGISGGKDSSVVAALCQRALGRERVIGVLMPCGFQEDLDMAHLLVSHLGIESVTINIKDTAEALTAALGGALPSISEQSRINMLPRIRMTALYAVSQSRDGRVANTSNLSEIWVGYSTRYGDSAGDFSPVSSLTATEVKEVGRALCLPDVLVEKVPADGLSGKTDEENLGFSYECLDRYIRTGICEDKEIKMLIDERHRRNKFKFMPIAAFDSGLYVTDDR